MKTKTPKEQYRLRLSCTNCYKDKYVYVNKGTPAWTVVWFWNIECDNCGHTGFSIHLFQGNN